MILMRNYYWIITELSYPLRNASNIGKFLLFSLKFEYFFVLRYNSELVKRCDI